MTRCACTLVWLPLLFAGGCEIPLDDATTFTCSADGQTCGGADDCYSSCYCDTEDAARCESRCGARGVRVQDLDESTWTSDWVAFEDEVIALVNEARAQGGCCGSECFGSTRPLSLDERLRRSARSHALDMARQGYFDHDSIDGRTPFDRMREAGFRGCALGENIAAGQRSAAEVVESWLDSPGHCANILDPSFDLIGVGYTEADDLYGNRWVQNFGG